MKIKDVSLSIETLEQIKKKHDDLSFFAKFNLMLFSEIEIWIKNVDYKAFDKITNETCLNLDLKYFMLNAVDFKRTFDDIDYFIDFVRNNQKNNSGFSFSDNNSNSLTIEFRHFKNINEYIDDLCELKVIILNIFSHREIDLVNNHRLKTVASAGSHYL